MIRVVTIQFSPAGKIYEFNAGNLELVPGNHVLVTTERGLSLGSVVHAPVEKDPGSITQPLATVQRLVGPEDENTIAHHKRREKEAFEFCQNRIKERQMDMKLVRVEQLFDGSKAIFYFTADGRVDFRELVKDLAHAFHTRIEMRQIGVRDEAKMVGGLGVCGRELCCASFLRDFQPVSVKMAKEQNLALNPSKISGQCGRLLCCLDYEYETYCELRKSYPRCGKRVKTMLHGGTVEKVNILTGMLTLRLEDGKMVNVLAKELVDENSHNTPQPEPVENQPAPVEQPKARENQPRRGKGGEPAADTSPPEKQPKNDEKQKRKKHNRAASRKSSGKKPKKPDQE